MWKIYYAVYSLTGRLVEVGVYPKTKSYKRKGYAERIGKKMFAYYVTATDRKILWAVGETNPFADMSFDEYLKLKE